MAMLDEAIQAIMRKKRECGLPDIYDEPLGAPARERHKWMQQNITPKPDIPVGSTDDVFIPGKAGQIPVRIVTPVSGPSDATVIYFHGGGWSVGDLDTHSAHVAMIAARCRATVVSVDYRLAPENPFPAAVEDAFAAVDWVVSNVLGLGRDPTKIAVAGDSAGGNLAAVSAVYCRDRGVELRGQLLIYPVTDMTKCANDPAARIYLGENHEAKASDPWASPFLLPNLAGVAPAVVGIGVYDFLYDDGISYARKLERDGVDVVLREYPDLNHGFFSFTAVSQSSKMAAEQLCDDFCMLIHQ